MSVTYVFLASARRCFDRFIPLCWLCVASSFGFCNCICPPYMGEGWSRYF